MATPVSIANVSQVQQLTTNNAVNSLIFGLKWESTSTNNTVNLTYSFGNSSSIFVNYNLRRTNPYDYTLPISLYGYGNNDEPFRGFNSLTNNQAIATQLSLVSWSNISNLNFVEVLDSSNTVGDIRFARTEANTGGGSTYALALSPEAGDVWLTYDPIFNNVTPGTEGYFTILHETGHALGLKHPHDLGFTGIAENSSINITTKYSVLSYRSYSNQPIYAGWQQDFYPTTPMLYDILAIQHIYGANTSFNNGNNTYSWQPGQQILETIWDSGGNDTIDWSNQSTAALINLNDGEWSQLGPAYNNGIDLDNETLAIAYNTTIENAVGGSGNDRIIGNQTNNILQGGRGNDTLTGESGNDTLRGYGGGFELDILAGGTGKDLFVLGNSSGIFYTGQGYATITDFSSVDDQILLGGTGDQYSVEYRNISGTTANDSVLFFQGDAVAVIQDTTQIDLSDDFDFA